MVETGPDGYLGKAGARQDQRSRGDPIAIKLAVCNVFKIVHCPEQNLFSANIVSACRWIVPGNGTQRYRKFRDVLVIAATEVLDQLFQSAQKLSN